MKQNILTYKYVLIILLMQIASHFCAADIVNVGEKYGLPIRRLTSLCRDADGFVYGVSYNGVTRISASECRLYNLPGASALFLANIYAVGNDVYVLSHSGEIYKLDRVQDRFVHNLSLSEAFDDANIDVYDVCASADSSLLLSTSLGIVRVSDEKKAERITEVPVWYVIPIADSSLLAVSEQGVFEYNLIDGTQSYRYKAKMRAVLSAYLDKKSNILWLGSLDAGVYTLDLSSKSPSLRRERVIDSRQPIRAITAYSDSTVLVGVDGGGVYEISADGKNLVNHYCEDIDDPFSLRGNGVFALDADTGEVKRHFDGDDDSACQFVFDILEDTEGEIWIGASEGGVAMYSRTTGEFTNYDIDVINSFLSLPDGMVMGEGSTGAYIFNKKDVSESDHMYKKYDIQQAIVYDDKLWLATSCHGIVGRGPDAMETQRFGVEQNLPFNTVNAICRMQDGLFLAGTENGLFKFNNADASVDIIVPNIAVNLHAIEPIGGHKYFDSGWMCRLIQLVSQ